MGYRKFGSQINDQDKPLDIMINPNGAVEQNTRLSNDAFWIAVERYLEDWNSRQEAGFSGHSIHTESITEIILEHLR